MKIIIGIIVILGCMVLAAGILENVDTDAVNSEATGPVIWIILAMGLMSAVSFILKKFNYKL